MVRPPAVGRVLRRVSGADAGAFLLHPPQVVGLSFNAFFPQVVATLGYGQTQSLLLCAPPFVFATLVSFAVARHSDAKQERFWHIVGPLCGGIVGFIIALSTTNTAARYISLFLQAASYAGFVCFYSWISGSFPMPPVR